MIGAGTIINPILKIATVVAVLAAVYFFIIKPVLDTTESAFDQFGEPFQNLPTQIQDDIDRALDITENQTQENALERCIDRALPNQQRVVRCVERFR